MVISEVVNDGIRLSVDGRLIEQVARFKYLGQWVSETWSLEGELRGRIEIARGAFNNMRSILCRRDLSFALRWRVVKCYIWSILLYGVETWTLKVKDINRPEAFEMWLIRRVLRILWTA
ncbi:hypothetical protein GE061_007472 [Apolygus lucorum]|uniref:Reverse transcriptase domain-containing protein n=1 Tax=Apolygus lucorum TaxID=248454 RepID=A0A6A4IQX7_APOLU|nr:hypothetical protein GE061_007472 [Apolygus lucorum]